MKNSKTEPEFKVITGPEKSSPERLAMVLSMQVLVDCLPTFKSKPFIANGNLTQFVNKHELCQALGVSNEKIDLWIENHIIPKPMDPDGKRKAIESRPTKVKGPGGKKGRRTLLWDLYEVLDWLKKYR